MKNTENRNSNQNYFEAVEINLLKYGKLWMLKNRMSYNEHACKFYGTHCDRQVYKVSSFYVKKNEWNREIWVLNNITYKM